MSNAPTAQALPRGLEQQQAIQHHHGPQDVVLHLSDNQHTRRILLGPDYRIRCEGELPVELKRTLGALQVWEEEPDSPVLDAAVAEPLAEAEYSGE